MSSTTTLAVLQPGYLPWLGFFDQLLRCDVFVLYDDVPYDKHGWRNRNRLKSARGPQWISVPVLHSGRFGQRVLDVEIDGAAPWARKHLGTIRHLYAASSHLDAYLGELTGLLSRPWRMLVDLDVALIEQMCAWLDIQRAMLRASKLGIPGKRSERLLRLCQHFGATRYLTGDAARSYLDVALFEAAGIEVTWQTFQHPVYPQLHGEFVPCLSALDLLLNCGKESGAMLAAASAGGIE